MSQPSPDIALYEKLLMVFPGYRGYKERELIRETDRVVRDSIYRRLKSVSEVLRGVYRDWVSRRGTTGADAIERVLYSVDSLAERVRHAPYGYKPLFHVVKVDEEKLRRLLEYDLALSEGVEKLAREVEAFRARLAEVLDIYTELVAIESAVREMEARLTERENVLLGLGGRK